MKPPASVPVPPGVVTETSTEPADPAGVTAVSSVALTIVNDAAGVEPKATAVATSRFVPVIVTDVPPAGRPKDGETEATVGSASQPSGMLFAFVSTRAPSRICP